MGISEKMMSTPITNPENVCPKCIAFQEYNAGEISIGLFRFNCQHCKSFGKSGIYKGDLVLAFCNKNSNSKKNNLTPGRKPTYFKTYGSVVKNLLMNNESVRSIAKLLGISTNSVMNIKNKLKSLEEI